MFKTIGSRPFLRLHNIKTQFGSHDSAGSNIGASHTMEEAFRVWKRSKKKKERVTIRNDVTPKALQNIVFYLGDKTIASARKSNRQKGVRPNISDAKL